MKKYYIIARNTWDEMLTYRVSFVMWRIRNIIQLLTIYFLWQVILPPGKTLLGYSQSLMLTYILGTSLIDSVVLSSRTELTLIFIILRPPFFIQTNPFYILFFVFSVILSLFIYFFLNFLLGLIAFWSPEVWAPRFIFITLLGFFAGSLFPLDILPGTLYEIMKFLPFTYLLYFPLKIYLGQLNLSQILSGLAISIFWVFAIYFLVKYFWQKGLKSYTAYGR